MDAAIIGIVDTVDVDATMTDQELRAMVRDVDRAARAARAGAPIAAARRSAVAAPFSAHASHLRLPLARGGDGDGACLIEPAVRCNHCGYCQSLGH